MGLLAQVPCPWYILWAEPTRIVWLEVKYGQMACDLEPVVSPSLTPLSCALCSIIVWKPGYDQREEGPPQTCLGIERDLILFSKFCGSGKLNIPLP